MQRRAFTLIELLTAIAILGIVIGLAIPRFLSIERSSRIRVANAQVDTIKKALGSYLATLPASQLSTLYGNQVSPTAAFIDGLEQYLDSDFLRTEAPQRTASGGFIVAYHTTTMRSLTGTPTVAQSIANPVSRAIISIPPATGVGHAHMSIYWSTSNRNITEPTVLIFTP